MPDNSREVRVSLIIDLDAHPITGSVTPADGAARCFSGWVGLIAALSATTDDYPPAPDRGVTPYG
jgi:hypothetical protein